MSQERKYQEEEVAAIFDAAARPVPGAPAPAEGLTLTELQAIGREVGLAPERIAEAAAALELRRDAVRRSDLGMPVAVGRTVELPRAPTEREWEMLVAELRETFSARGRVGARGDVREWSNGNLHAYVEPTADGYRLRLGTLKGDAAPLNRMGIGVMTMALVTLVVLFLSGALEAETSFLPLMLALLGGAAIGWNALRLPSWAQQREAQMERIAVRARELLSRPAPEEASAAIPARVEDGG
ncbi:MAG TPA: hypothetical protein VFQ39_13510 [Longimicrobium sp.]|nr:hypothetical protein [Longimicrobium sp.]